MKQIVTFYMLNVTFPEKIKNIFLIKILYSFWKKGASPFFPMRFVTLRRRGPRGRGTFLSNFPTQLKERNFLLQSLSG
jgi:hypothetical protein